MIIEGHLQPGAHIIEAELCHSLGVSRTPLREALKTLASEGLVNLLPARGAFVSAPTFKETRELLEVLTGLESIAGRLACERATDTEIAALRRKNDAMVRCFRNHKRLEYYKLNMEIHARLVALSHNAELRRLHANCSGRLRRLRFLSTATPSNWSAAIAEHQNMMTALEERDADKLARLMREHMQLIWERLHEVLAPERADASTSVVRKQARRPPARSL